MRECPVCGERDDPPDWWTELCERAWTQERGRHRPERVER